MDDQSWGGIGHNSGDLGLSGAELAEFDRTYGNQLWRLQNLYKVHCKPTKEDPRGGIRNFKMWPNQQHMYENRWYRNLILKSRQLGSSTFWCLFVLDACLFGDEPVRAGIVSYTKDSARELLEKCKLAFEEMDEDVKALFGLTMTAKQDKLTFSNKSHIKCGITMRGGTVDVLLVSEMGKLAAAYPAKCKEVVTGCFPTVPTQNGMIIVESTAEGHGGRLFDMVAEATEIRDNPSRLLGDEDFALHFFPWHQQREYRSKNPYELTETDKAYFERLRLRGILLDQEQKWWYARKRAELQDEIFREFPSYQAEAFMASSGALILAKAMVAAEENGQVGLLPYDETKPVVCSWDLGNLSAIWLYQYISPTQRCYINYVEGDNADFKLLKRELDRLADLYGYQYGAHVFPVDAENKVGMTDTMLAFAREAGLENIETVPLLPFVDQCRYANMMMPASYFDADNTMLGRQRILSYRRIFDSQLGDFVDKPRKDTPSHGAEAWLTSLFYNPANLTMPRPTGRQLRVRRPKKKGFFGRLFGKEERPVKVASSDGTLVMGNSLLRRLLQKR